MSWLRTALSLLPLRCVLEVFYLSSSDPWRYWRSEFENQRYDAAVSLIAPQGPGAILEVGCSVGAFTRRLLALCPRALTGVDISALALRRARRTLGPVRGDVRLDLVCLDVFRQPLPRGSFDLVVAMDVLGYTEDSGVLRATRDRLLAALAPGGCILLGNTKLAAHDGEGFQPFASGFPRLGARAILDCVGRGLVRVGGFEEERYRLDLLRASGVSPEDDAEKVSHSP